MKINESDSLVKLESDLQNVSNLPDYPNRLSSELDFNLSIFVISLKKGFIGFFITFLLLISTKLMAFSFTVKDSFEVNLQDIIFSFWGFLFLSLISLISSLRNKNHNQRFLD